MVNRDSVRLSQEFLHVLQVVNNGLFAVFAVDEIGNVGQGSRAVQGIHGNEVLEFVRLEFLEVFLHSGGFVLEDPDGFSFLKKSVGQGILQGEILRCRKIRLHIAHQFNGIVDDGQGIEPQKVHFEQSGCFGHLVIELGDQGNLSIRGVLDRNIIG